MRIPLLIAVSLVVVVNVVASLEIGDSIFGFVKYLPGNDLAGHFGLYAAIGFCVALFVKEDMRKHKILVIAAVLLIVLEELSQNLLEHRTFSIADLAASLSGFTFGLFIIRLISMTGWIKERMLSANRR